MALPKRRHSRTRGRKRRTHFTLSRPTGQSCPHCGAAKRPHTICAACGWYAGRVIPGIVKEETKETK